MKKIIVIEDTKIQLKIIEGFLKDKYSLTLFTDGKEALKEMEDNQFDLLICDLKMPIITGQEILAKMNEANINIPTLIVTADIQLAVREDCINLGAKGFIEKPVDKSSLLDAVSEILD